MNRLIILGNGFDLAHGLKTAYSDFIRHYWNNVKIPDTDNFFEFKVSKYQWRNPKFNSMSELVERYCIDYSMQDRVNTFNVIPSVLHKTMIVKNEFFYSLNRKYSEVNWVNVENEYFAQLRKIMKKDLSPDVEVDLNRKVELIKTLNKGLEEIVELFNSYLLSEIIPAQTGTLNLPIKSMPYSIEKINEFLSLYSKKYQSKIDETIQRRAYEFIPFNNTTILNFNYTDTHYRYFNNDEEVINIHGNCTDQLNPINMGFGNENDPFYKLLEEYDVNEFLRFTKSFNYTKNNGYKRLTDRLESEVFQVFILGHSCGLSDKTLLNTIFEHPNCVSIMPFYHSHPEKRNELGEYDNYTELAMNISRHFNKPVLMRERLVNKNDCLKMPQIPRASG